MGGRPSTTDSSNNDAKNNRHAKTNDRAFSKYLNRAGGSL